MRKEIFIFSTLLVLSLLNNVFASAQSYNEGLILELIGDSWQNIASGEIWIAQINIKNNTDYILDGKARLLVEYQGICSNNQKVRFEGEGIYPYFSIDKQNTWIEPESFVWNNGEIFFSNFQIQKGETSSFLKIKTDPLLCPGNYTLTFTLEGTAEEEKYMAPPIVISGESDYYLQPATSKEEKIITLTNPDGSKIELIIPADVVSRNIYFTIEKVDISSAIQAGLENETSLIADLLCEIKAQKDGEFITNFDKPLTLIFTYTDEQIKGLDESSLKIYYWNKTLNRWTALENSEIDIENNTVTASIDHFTLFALIGLKTAYAEEGEEIRRGEEKKEEIMISGRKEEEKERENLFEEGAKKGIRREEGEENKRKEKASGGLPQKALASMIASVGMIWKKVGKPAFLVLVVILCVIGLVSVSFKKEWLFWRKRKK